MTSQNLTCQTSSTSTIDILVTMNSTLAHFLNMVP
uniref:Uncharacterized protein n=1 Tax=Arundo donax TaxID=35708 RepID=A0A0A8ZAL8_ARUDO